jgi:hypothetical protein
MILRVNPIAASHRNDQEDLENGSLELIAKIDSSNIAKFDNFLLSIGHYKVVCLPGNITVSFELTCDTQNWRNRLGFVNLTTLGLG